MKKKGEFHLVKEFTNIFNFKNIRSMKKFLCLALLLAGFNAGFSQTIDDVKKVIDKSDWAAAKKAIDGVLANEKLASKPEAWYYKGVIYNECSKKEDLLAGCPNCKMEAFNALKKYQVMDPKNVYMVLEQNVRLFDLYNGYFDLASKAYEAKDYAGAYTNFSNASMVEDYIRDKGFEYNGFKFGALDTSLVQNMGLSARLAKNDAEAVKNYERLAAINLSGPANLEMYQYLTQYYIDTKNQAALNAILEKGKKLYPGDEYWTEVEIDQVDKKDKTALFAKYEEVMAKNPGSYTVAYNYGVEIFNYLYVGDGRPADFDAKKAKLDELLKKALALKNSPEANMLMARHLYNDVYDTQDAIKKIKGTKPEDAKKRVELKGIAGKQADECIKYADAAVKIYAAMPKLKPIEKANYKNALGILESMYGYKGNTAKADEYKKQAEAM
jgi:predicted  nucleic acid-binding Zn-ribbon protein